jgi:superfamily I DNA/RNA helicase
MALLLGGPLSGKTTRVVNAFRQHMAVGRSPRAIACLSFFAFNAALIRRDLQQHAGGFLPWVTTLQRFQSLLLRQYAPHARLPRRTREIDPGARALLLRLAWERAGGDLWSGYGGAPGGLAELTRVVDWVSAHRAGFTLRPGELGEHELARAYEAYIALCDEHRLLTFQEASLRCLDLLDVPEVAADVARRFPVLLVDDAHLARPDQLRLLDRLRALAQDAVATAWLEPDHAAPELRLAWDTLHAWGPVEHLAPRAEVNPAVVEVAWRATGRPNPSPAVDGQDGAPMPVGLFAGSTVEEEMQALAARVAATLDADPALRPADLAVVALNPDLLPFAERVLGEWGLPISPRPLPAPHTPLVRAALLAIRWVRRPRQRAETEPELLSLPCIPLDPLDRHALLRAGALTGQPPLAALADEAAVRLAAPVREGLARLAQALAALDARLPASVLADQALEALGAPAWLRADQVFTLAEHADWERAYAGWRRMAQELEALLARGLPAPEDLDDYLAALADQVSRPAPPGDSLVLVRADQANGIRARHAFVIGLSENAAPRRRAEMQLIAEAELPRLLPAGLPPLARHPAAWLEREARALAAALTRGAGSLYLSTSRHSANGDAQLPSPFFERLLGADGVIDRDGALRLHPDSRLFRHQPRAAQPQAEAEPRSPAEAAAEAQAAPPAGLRSSASQIRAYLTCPLSYYYERVLGLETEGSAALDRGGLLHELLCVVLGDGTPRAVQLWDRPRPAWLGAGTALSERAQMALEAAWRGAPVDLPGGGRYVPAFAWGERFGPDLQRRAVRRWMAQMLAQWADFEANGPLAHPRRRPVLLETTFEFDLGPHRLRGRVDRLDEVQGEAGPTYELIDYKSGKGASVAALMQNFLPPEDAPAKDYQLPIYALAWLRGALLPAPAAPLRLHLLFLDNMQRGKRGGLSATACRTLEVGAAGALDPGRGFVPLSTLDGQVTPAIEATLESMTRAPYPARPGWACKQCSFRIACDRGQEGDPE